MRQFDSQAEKAYNLLKQKILTREMPQGASIVERDVAEELGLSRTPVREAVKQLAADGLVDTYPRRGAFVRIFTITDLVKLYEIAEGLEGMVGYLIAEKCKKKQIASEDLQNLSQQVAEMQRLGGVKDFKKWAEIDEAFHRHLYQLCDNPYILEHATRIRTQLNVTLYNTIPTFIDFEKSNQEHQKFLETMFAGDAETARTTLQQQHERIRELLVSYQ